jgi:hypothetical protein
MPASSLLIVTVDGLRASALGAYGNTIYPTPELDHFAAEGFLFDACYAPSEDLGAVYRALWQSASSPTPRTAGTTWLPSLLAQRGYTTNLITDASELGSDAAAADFDQCIQIGDSSPFAHSSAHAEDVSHTALGRLFAAASDVISQPPPSPSLSWVHARGMYGPWDAPLDLQTSLLDEGDPTPVQSVEPPDLLLTANDDPDAAFRYGCAYAAQVMVLDACWKGLTEAISISDRPWFVMLLGARGFPLGEHGRIGGIDPRLYGEQLHVPWLIRFPDGTGRLARYGRLASLLDVTPTLLHWLGGEVPDEAAAGDGRSSWPLIRNVRDAWRESLFFASDTGHRAIRTDEWCLRQDANPNDAAELYVRPDDRWESNDVAKLCPEVVERLSSELAAHLAQPS